MTWASWPIAAVAAGIAVPALLILYFLKLRRRDLEVSTTLLWKKSIQDLQANAPFQRLRRNILLLLQLLALAAILLALGQPEMRSDTGVGRRHVILIDRSASMNAKDGDSAGMSRLEAAKKAAKDLVDSFPEPGYFSDAESGDQAMVIAFDTAADRRQSFTASKSELRRAIDGIEPTDGPSSIQDAIKVAKAYSPRVFMENKGFVGRGAPMTLHLFSDGRLPDSARLAANPQELEAADLTPDDQVVYHAVGKSDAPNLGITGVRAERAFDNPGQLTIFVGIQNATREPRSVDVELSIDNRVASVTSIKLDPATSKGPAPSAPAGATPASPAGDGAEAAAKPAAAVPDIEPATGGAVFKLDRPDGGVAVARLVKNEPDVLPTDDIAYLILPPAKRLSVALVTEGNLWAREVLEGMNLSRRYVIKPAVFQKMVDGERVDNVGLGDFDVVILDRWLPTGKDAAGKPKQFLPPGRVLVLGIVPPPPLGLEDGGPGEASLIVDWSRDHSALKYAGLSELVIGRSRKVKIAPDTPVRSIAQSQTGPAIVEAANDSTRAIIVTFDPGESDWPLKPGFVLFIASSLTYLASDDAGVGANQGGSPALGDAVRPGQTLVQRLPVGASDVRLTLPDSSKESLVPAPDGRIAWGPIRNIGFYSVAWEGPALPTDPMIDGHPRRLVAANLLDADESLVATRDSLELPGRVVAAKSAQSAESLRKLWPWLLLGALGVIMLEWFVYNRKVHV